MSRGEASPCFRQLELAAPDTPQSAWDNDDNRRPIRALAANRTSSPVDDEVASVAHVAR